MTEGADGKPSTARLTYVWRLAGSAQPWTYDTSARADPGRRRRLAGTRSDRTSSTRTSRTGETLRLTSVSADRADITGAGGSPLVTERPGAAVRHRQGAGVRGVRRPRGPSAGPGGRASTPRRTPRGSEQAGPKAFVEAIVLRAGDARQQALRGAPGHRRGAVVRDTLPLAPTREFARPILGTVGAGDRRDREEVRRRLPGRGRGRAERAGGAVRRAAARHTRRDGRGRRRQGRGPSAVQRRARAPGARSPPPSTRGCRASRSRRCPTSRPASAAGRDPAVDRRRARGGERRQAAAGCPPRPSGSTPPARRSRWSAAWRCCGPGVEPSSTMYCPATVVVDGKRFKNYDDYPAGGHRPHPAQHRGRELLQHRLHRRAGDRHRSPSWPTAAASLGLGVDHDLGFPAYFGVGAGHRRRGRLGDRARRLDDRPGPGDRLTAGDGRRGRVGGEGQRRRAPAAAGPADRRRGAGRRR